MSNDGKAVGLGLIRPVISGWTSFGVSLGPVSFEPQTIQGTWLHQGQEYHDELVRVFVDVADESYAKEFFERFKEQLKERFQQLDIWITTYPIDLI